MDVGPDRDPPAEEPRSDRETSGLAFIKDNLEAFAVAVIMALVIKHFCVEAFKIPTGSMVPTLLGDNYSSERDGDRILVAKFAYLFDDPDRWHIPVFRYPLNRARNFIKRIVGLSGEHLRIHAGDIWVKAGDDDDAVFRIARKNARVRNQLYFPTYPPADAEAPGGEADADLRSELEDTWKIDGPEGAWRLEHHGRFAFVGGPRASLVTRHSIHSDSNHWGWPASYDSNPLARDIRVSFRVTRGPPGPADLDEAKAPDEVVVNWSPDGQWEAVLVLSTRPDESSAQLLRDGRGVKFHPLPGVSIAPKASMDVTLEYVDGDLRAWVDGDELAVLADDRTIDGASPRAGQQSLTLQAAGSPYVIEGLTIDRDLYYENEFAGPSDWEQEGIRIPEGAYFVLGDNTGQSSDSRKWRIRTVPLRDGTEIRYDDGDGPGFPDDGFKRVVDVEGVERIWHEDDEDPDRGSTPRNAPQSAPFVWRELIVGRAFLVFWPLGPEFPGRLRFIH